MAWWNPSWLSLPSLDIPLPSAIQRRFISFILKRSLGHLLKPGQLDVQQIDSQIGSGYVQVRDLELDYNAVNALLTGVPLQLHDGSISSVTARVPWPNPLTSNVGLSIESLHLTFHVVSTEVQSADSSAHLADSVLSVAESFMHDELTPGEEASLRESVHPDLAASFTRDHVPGGLDQSEEVLHGDVDPAGVSIFATMIERLLSRFEFDARDTVITLIHPGHSSFTFSVAELRYGKDTSLDPAVHATAAAGAETRALVISGVQLTSCNLRRPDSGPVSRSPTSHARSPVQRMSPRAQSPLDPFLHSSSPSSSTVSPTTMAGSLPVHHPIVSIGRTAADSSPTSSDSDMDEESQFMMSQSIVSLPPPVPHPSHPPRSHSPASDVASSMFQSAISTIREESEVVDTSVVSLGRQNVATPPAQDPHEPIEPNSLMHEPTAQEAHGHEEGELHNETMLSFASEPVIIRITTSPLPPTAQSGSAPPSNVPISQDNSEKRTSQVHITLTMGVIACAIRAWQVRSIMDIADTLAASQPPRLAHPPRTKVASAVAKAGFPSLSMLDQAEIAVQVRGVVLLLLPSGDGNATLLPTPTSPDLTSFFAHPVVPPKLRSGYVRLFVDTLDASASVVTTVSHGTATQTRSTQQGNNAAGATSTTATQASLSISDISVCAFCMPKSHPLAAPSQLPSEYEVIPILLTDPHLPSQYDPEHHPPPNLADVQLGPGSSNPPELPSLDVPDWTSRGHRSKQAKLSAWRVRPQKQRHSLRSPRHVTSLPSSPRSVTSELPPDAMEAKATPALVVKVDLSSSTPSTGPGLGAEAIANFVDADFAPLHIVLDLSVLLDDSSEAGAKSAAMGFLDDVAKSTTGQRTAAPPSTAPSSEIDSDDDGEETEDDRGRATPSASPSRVHITRPGEQQNERQRERQRLERLVLEDLNLSMDYLPKQAIPERPRQIRSSKRRKISSSPQVFVRFPLIRAQIRCPSPPKLSPRSGALVLDVHGVVLSTYSSAHSLRQTRFAEAEERDSEAIGDRLLTAEWQRLVVACSMAGSPTATALLSVGAPSIVDVAQSPVGNRPFLKSHMDVRHAARIVLSRNKSLARRGDHTGESMPLIVTADIPSVHANLSKPVLDGLQLWADDVTQFFERLATASQDLGSDTDSRDPSLIGSRFFVKTKRGSQDAESGTSSSLREGPPKGEVIIKATISQVFARLLLTREKDHGHSSVPFDIFVSSLDALLELKPEGKDETVVTVSVMDLGIVDRTSNSPFPYLMRTSPISPLSTPRPLIKLRFTSLVVPSTTAKESRVKLTLCDFTYNLIPDLQWVAALAQFAKPPPGAFESVVPSERTHVSVKVMDGSIRLLAHSHPGAFVIHLGDLEFSTEVVGDSPETALNISAPSLSAFFTDDHQALSLGHENGGRLYGVKGNLYWKKAGYALITEMSDLILMLKRTDGSPPRMGITVDDVKLRLHLCADSGLALGAFFGEFGKDFAPADQDEQLPVAAETSQPATISIKTGASTELMSSIDERAFQRVPEVGAAPDMINDDLPSNPEYLDESFGAAAGLRVLDDEELDDFNDEYSPVLDPGDPNIISRAGGETIKLMLTGGIHLVENYFNTLPALVEETPQLGDVRDAIRIHNAEVTVFLYEGYDWSSTRKTIEHEVKEMKRRLAKIRQLVSEGQTFDPTVEETSTLLYNSIYLGLEQDIDDLEPKDLVAAIDEELKEDIETASVSSWQSLPPPASGKPAPPPVRLHGQRLTRAKGPSIEFRLLGVNAEVDQYMPDEEFVSRTFATVKDVEILDHVKTSTWRKFLTALRSDSRGNIRETGSNMVRFELRTVRPVPGNPSEEARLRAKLLPLRLHVDQDALDFLKKFFSFKDANAPPPTSGPQKEIYFQRAEVFPVGLKLDYKPRRVDYRALREGKTIELMNFFHFDGAEMTLRHITLAGVTGWPRFFDLLNDMWTPDVKATQLADVISGVAPIRSVVNVGSGVADLVLLPIAQYRKDGRVVRGVQKGTEAFVRSTAMEAIKLGARLATGTQVILEQTENVIGSQFNETVLAETVQAFPADFEDPEGEPQWSTGGQVSDPISRYAEQPMNVTEGIQTAYASLRRNLNSAAQTILAVPMEVYERSGNEGPVRAVIRAVPIAVLKPMIGASEAVSKALLGLHNSMDPDVRYENEAKYKHR
ncbi:hypothetical protein FA95DRAFT_1585813 [Auriscalpium vulgare]|uniref:Uncharacterized protein n=1 Tax=Auriscalpium vulgare TaxID=40419 RepID=A0ACB8SDT9_9AGAM|nr:hypothetical protein FA95DRAFT_1585813 [Auriscalpium vulgare]